MNFFAKLMRALPKVRFKALGLATIKDVPTEDFQRLIKSLLDSGWEKTYVYNGFDAWIDYGCVKLAKGSRKLKLEWDNWTEGSVEGRRQDVEALAREMGFAVSEEWRWSEWDDP